MRTLPRDFAELLSRRGHRILEGRDAAVNAHLARKGDRFLPLADALDRTRCAAALALIDRALGPHLTPMESAIPPEAIFAMEENYAELLPKTVRVKTALLENRRSQSSRAAASLGLTALLNSKSFGAFAAAVSGRVLERRWGTQVLCYGPGDYSGPHNDHHPEDAEARDGYLDLHITLCTQGVSHQWLVYAERGHFSRIVPVHTLGGMTAYRLPFWHYTTPLVAKPRQEANARRWVLLGTFLYAGLAQLTGTAPPSS